MIAKLIKKHQGRVVDSPGDNILAEFGSAVNSVRSAVEIQANLQERYVSDISADGSILYFASKHDGGQGGSDIWQVKIIPSVNLGGTGKNKN